MTEALRIEADWLRSDGARRVCAVLTDAGYDAWFVGGCVRNAILNEPVADLDISTNARPEQVLALAQDKGLTAVPTGIDHGTVTVVVDHLPYEITTYRRDVATDGRRAVVAFADTIEEDAARRDLTINALYAGPDGRMVDPLGGLPDLLARRIRFIGDPFDRIREDYLRILRFFRFYAWYGDPAEGLDPDGLAACAELAEGVETLSRERIGHEVRKLLQAPDPGPALASIARCGVLMRILPGASAAQVPVLVHVEEEAGFGPGLIRRLVALGGEDADDRLRLSKAEVREVDRVRAALESGAKPAELGYRHGLDTATDALLLRAVVENRTLTQDELAQAKAGAAAEFPIAAKDLMPDTTGPALGAALRALEDRWIASGFTLSRDELLTFR
ncbi:CCA tRNA nucleotidyltransferase [Loktanella sp. IMCC34160]|uniref:CCA tRNA nucleotidyltransferase n=1 Tax=Loktanella sp. IMCC34160 TaxID=2510646 RepID=UPI00101DAE13|nr:CCA tRNA nucleotidyltransferase [Loktanella sp. IMCC34160]RYG91349.1 CCA tRNA nucleotidyltransferase [Loktanella sp. IMCC34160]